MSTTEINITKTDNELILIATTPSDSSTLCHIKSGYNAPVSYRFNPADILESGHYELKMVGLNWGGPGNFEVQVTSNGQTQTYSGSAVDFWTESVPMSI